MAAEAPVFDFLHRKAFGTICSDIRVPTSYRNSVPVMRSVPHQNLLCAILCYRHEDAESIEMKVNRSDSKRVQAGHTLSQGSDPLLATETDY